MFSVQTYHKTAINFQCVGHSECRNSIEWYFGPQLRSVVASMVHGYTQRSCCVLSREKRCRKWLMYLRQYIISICMAHVTDRKHLFLTFAPVCTCAAATNAYEWGSRAFSRFRTLGPCSQPVARTWTQWLQRLPGTMHILQMSTNI
jgi:hypothetical protein